MSHTKKSLELLPDFCIQGTDGQLMVMAAHRYCLGRRSYIVGSCIDWLTAWWNSFERNTQRIILRDTIQALMEGHAGDDMDIKGWFSFAEKHLFLLKQEDQDWIKESLRHIHKPWPFQANYSVEDWLCELREQVDHTGA